MVKRGTGPVSAALYPLTFRKGKPLEHVMFTAHHSSSSSNAFYCDPQAVKAFLGRERKKAPSANVAPVDNSKSQARQGSCTSASAPVLRFIQPEKEPKTIPRTLKKREKAKEMCAMLLGRSKSSP